MTFLTDFNSFIKIIKFENSKLLKLQVIFRNFKIPILTYLKQIFRQIFIFISYFYYLKEEQDESVHADNAAMQ